MAKVGVKMFVVIVDYDEYVCLVAERPQHMLMRVAVGIHKNDIDAAIEVIVYDHKLFT